MIPTITNRAHPTELADKFSALLPPYQWAKYVPMYDFDGYEGAYDFLIDAIFRHRGRVIVADVDFFIFDWYECIKTAWSNADIIVPEASIPHRVTMPEHIGNPFFWVFDADRARAAIAKSGLTREGLRTFGASGVMHAEPFWGLYDFLYSTAKLPFQALDVSTHADGVSTVCDFGIHTWYAREYNQDKRHTKRINQHYQWAHSKKSTL
jgi:hypothetical protein